MFEEIIKTKQILTLIKKTKNYEQNSIDIFAYTKLKFKKIFNY